MQDWLTVTDIGPQATNRGPTVACGSRSDNAALVTTAVASVDTACDSNSTPHIGRDFWPRSYLLLVKPLTGPIEGWTETDSCHN